MLDVSKYGHPSTKEHYIGKNGMSEILIGDVRDVLPTLSSDQFDCVVTSPPYWGLRDYGVEGQIGLEPTMQGYLDTMVGVCRELRRVLKPEGTFWLNIGDCYNAGRNGGHPGGKKQWKPNQQKYQGRSGANVEGLKPKDLCMIPNRLAIALQEDGWYVRSEIIWAKTACMPESVKDRPTSSHEKVWLLTKNDKYFYDADAIKTPVKQDWGVRNRSNGKYHNEGTGLNPHSGLEKTYTMANARNVWSIPPKPFKGAHFATMPPELAERCIKAGCPQGGSILDPFGGAGTTGLMANRLGRQYTLIELNDEYASMAKDRIHGEAPLLEAI